MNHCQKNTLSLFHNDEIMTSKERKLVRGGVRMQHQMDVNGKKKYGLVLICQQREGIKVHLHITGSGCFLNRFCISHFNFCIQCGCGGVCVCV